MELGQFQVLDSTELNRARGNAAILCDESVVYGLSNFDYSEHMGALLEHMSSKGDVFEEQILGFTAITLTKIDCPDGKPMYAREVTFTPLLSVANGEVTNDVSGIISVAYFDLYEPTMLAVKSGDEIPYAQLEHIPTSIADHFFTIATESGLHTWIDEPPAQSDCEHLIPSLSIVAVMCAKYHKLGINYFELYDWWVKEAIPQLVCKFVTMDMIATLFNTEFDLVKSNFKDSTDQSDVFHKSVVIAMLSVLPEEEWVCAYAGALEQLWTNGDAIESSDREWFKTLKFNKPHDLQDLIRLQEIATAYSK